MRVVESGIAYQGGDGLHGAELHRPGAEREATVVVEGEVSAVEVAGQPGEEGDDVLLDEER
jgi:hypothetical protein